MLGTKVVQQHFVLWPVRMVLSEASRKKDFFFFVCTALTRLPIKMYSFAPS